MVRSEGLVTFESIVTGAILLISPKTMYVASKLRIAKRKEYFFKVFLFNMLHSSPFFNKMSFLKNNMEIVVCAECLLFFF